MDVKGIRPGAWHWVAAVTCAILLAGMPAGPAWGQAKQDQGVEMLKAIENAFSSVAAKAMPAVVSVRVEKTVKAQQQELPFEFGGPEDFFRRFFGEPGQGGQQPQQQPPRQRELKQKEVAQGSGFIISKDGHILTNNHVVDGADSISVTLKNGNQYQAKLIGRDPKSDVAVIQIPGDDFPVLPLGDSDELKVGQWVIAIGNPFGLSETVTVGVVSAVGRNTVGIADYEDFIQTDAAINPGNSGGPLINVEGQVVGINTAIYSRSGGYMGIGFAIPINMAKFVQGQLIKYGKVTRGYMGIGIQEVSPELAKAFGLTKSEGVLVAEVMKDSPAAKAGIKQGDIVVKLNGEKASGVGDFRNKVATLAPGSKVTVTVWRNGKEQPMEMTLAELPEQVAKAAPTPTQEKLGVQVQALTADLAKQFGYETGQGVIVSQVDTASPADNAGIKAGTLILSVDQKAVNNVEQYNEAIKAAEAQKTVLLLIRQGEMVRYVVLRWE